MPVVDRREGRGKTLSHGEGDPDCLDLASCQVLYDGRRGNESCHEAIFWTLFRPLPMVSGIAYRRYTRALYLARHGRESTCRFK